MKPIKDVKGLVEQTQYSLDDLVDIVAILRGEGGCPWDMEQTHASIRDNLIEETYEVVEGIDNRDSELMREELGDLLFQIVFHAQIECEAGCFQMDDVITDISKKMIHRHPHVFGTVEVSGTSEVLTNWENIKTEEKQRNTLADKLRAIPPMLPALMRAQKVAKKCGKYDKIDRAELCVRMREALDALEKGTDTEAALGELLMNASAYAHKSELSAEEALTRKTDRLIEEIANTQ
jgi:tetrapyrrole methylase family protein/MazG family protein